MNGKSQQQVSARTTPANGEIQRLMRALQTLSAANRALLQAVDESALLQEICRVVVEDSGYRLAWASYAEHDDAKSIRPVARAGFEAGWLNTLHSTWADTGRGRGPTGTAIRTGQPQAVRDVQTDANLAYWRDEAAKHGYASVLALPLRVDGNVIGALTIYASEPEAFDDEERRLLVQTAEDLGFGLGALRARMRAQKAEQAVRRLAFYDALTGLPNRVSLREFLERAIAGGKRENRPLSLLMVGVATFHEINDVLGYLEGDKLLVEVARRAQSVVLNSDALARVAEDEFAVLLTHGGAEYATGIAKMLLQTLAQPIELSGFMVEPRISVGIALFPGHGTEPDQLIRRGNMALQQATGSGSGVAFYTGSLDKDNERRLMLMGDLRNAIEHDDLLLYCQPKIHIGSSTLCGAEALVRWMHPAHGMIVPTEFVKIAEQTGLITPMTYWVLEAALRQLYSWRESGIKRPLAVNLSGRDLRDPKLIDHIKGSMATWGTHPDEIQFELTESALMEDPGGALVTLSRLKDIGVKLSIDDFGTGYSSLSYLQKLPVDAIKIDQSFVSKITTDEQSETIVRSTIELAHNLKLEVIAEGVESREIWDRVSALECDIAQGYFIGKPIPSAEFADWHAKSSWSSIPA
jgi:diguanylate cyclase (GGDEF)-like protein